MLLFAFIALIAAGLEENTAIISSNETHVHGGALVDGVEKSLGVCTSIVREVKYFRNTFITTKDLRRLSERRALDFAALIQGVKKKLGTCVAINQAVDTFRKDFMTIQNPEGALGAGTFKDLIILNVGGKRFSTTLSNLRSIRGTRLEKMFREGANTTISADGTYFIDRDPSSFGYVLDYLRSGDLFIKSDDQILRSKLLADAQYYKLPTALQDYLRWSPAEDFDLWFSEVDFLNKQLKKVSKELGGLLFQASKDGQSDSSFHSRCDSKGPTVVIIKTKSGSMFGGYSYASWSSSAGYAASSKAFLFRLRPTIKRYEQRSGRESYAIYRHSSYGPVFGNHNIFINDCYNVAQCYVNSANAYVMTGYELNDGQYYFRMDDYIVVQAKSF